MICILQLQNLLLPFPRAQCNIHGRNTSSDSHVHQSWGSMDPERLDLTKLKQAHSSQAVLKEVHFRYNIRAGEGKHASENT